MKNSKCKICRRVGVKLFLKGDRCFGQKCEIIKRNYPPGIRPKRRGRKVSEYGKELMEKQKLKNWYGLGERQFKNYVKDALAKRGGAEDAGDLLIRRIESRLDNVVFRMGFASSRGDAKQLVSHGYILVNDRKADISSMELKKGDTVQINSKIEKKKKGLEIKERIKSYNPPVWISLDKDKLKGQILNLPTTEEADAPVETSIIFEFYSK